MTQKAVAILRQIEPLVSYGVKTFMRWAIGKSFFIEGQGEALNGKNQNRQRQWKPALWAGTGYQWKIGKYWGLNLTVR